MANTRQTYLEQCMADLAAELEREGTAIEDVVSHASSEIDLRSHLDPAAPDLIRRRIVIQIDLSRPINLAMVSE
jgi:hypothetical protein